MWLGVAYVNAMRYISRYKSIEHEFAGVSIERIIIVLRRVEGHLLAFVVLHEIAFTVHFGEIGALVIHLRPHRYLYEY